MWNLWRKMWLGYRRRQILDPDEIFLDSRNLPSFNTQQFEGVIEKPIGKKAITIVLAVFFILALFFLGRLLYLQVVEGEVFAKRSNQNRLRQTLVFADRGIIYDRNGVPLAWNDPKREYIPTAGFSQILGYIGFPNELELKDKDFNPKEYIGKNGVENIFNDILMGAKGVKIEEINALGKIESDYVLKIAKPGESVAISIDSRVQAELYKIIKDLADEHGFSGGAAAIMDVTTGEVLALVSYPEFDSNIMASGDGAGIRQQLNDNRNLFLNRPVSGLYAPGSTMKLYIAIGALAENLISPTKTIVSTGQLVVPNPYHPESPSIFKDNKAHGAVDMKRALAVSSNVYFYTIGGGFGGQKGLGIKKIEKYSRLFGFGQKTGIELNAEEAGVIPNPEWKELNFNGEPWRLGDTYHTAIGQYGYLVTPLQVARAVAVIASDGLLFKPTLRARPTESRVAQKINIKSEDFQVIREGMRQTVTNGTAIVLNTSQVAVAAKSGTAQVGAGKSRINAWISGFFPYDQPRYSFVVVMENGPLSTNAGGGMVMRRLLDWMVVYAPEYLK